MAEAAVAMVTVSRNFSQNRRVWRVSKDRAPKARAASRPKATYHWQIRQSQKKFSTKATRITQLEIWAARPLASGPEARPSIVTALASMMPNRLAMHATTINIDKVLMLDPAVLRPGVGIRWMVALLLLQVLGNSIPAATAGPEIAIASEPFVYLIKSSQTDRAIVRFDQPNYVVFNRSVAPTAQLVLFLPGTGGSPANAVKLLKVVADQGYRV